MHETLVIKEIDCGGQKLIFFKSFYIQHRIKHFRKLENRMMFLGSRGKNISVDAVSLKGDLFELKCDINNGRFGEDQDNPIRTNTITAHNLLISYLERKQKILEKLACVQDKKVVPSLVSEFEKIIKEEEESSLNSLIEDWNKKQPNLLSVTNV